MVRPTIIGQKTMAGLSGKGPCRFEAEQPLLADRGLSPKANWLASTKSWCGKIHIAAIRCIFCFDYRHADPLYQSGFTVTAPPYPPACRLPELPRAASTTCSCLWDGGHLRLIYPQSRMVISQRPEQSVNNLTAPGASGFRCGN